MLSQRCSNIVSDITKLNVVTVLPQRWALAGLLLYHICYFTLLLFLWHIQVLSHTNIFHRKCNICDTGVYEPCSLCVDNSESKTYAEVNLNTENEYHTYLNLVMHQEFN